jgi:hypothetical protein
VLSSEASPDGWPEHRWHDDGVRLELLSLQRRELVRLLLEVHVDDVVADDAVPKLTACWHQVHELGAVTA